MRRYTLTEVPVPADVSFARMFQIKFEDDSIPNYGEFERWCRYNLKGHFYLAERSFRHLAGGCSPPESQAWYHPNPWQHVECYELRLSDELDAHTLLRVWTIPEQEKKRNDEWVKERNFMQAGWIKVHGKFIGQREVAEFYEKHHKPESIRGYDEAMRPLPPRKLIKPIEMQKKSTAKRRGRNK